MEIYIVLFFIIILTVTVIGFLGNIVVLIVYLFDKKLRSFTNSFFVNLSIVDILIVLICLPVGLLDMIYEGYWVLGEFMCNYQHFIEGVLISVSSLTLISISIERFLAISQPLQVSEFFHQFKVRKARNLPIRISCLQNWKKKDFPDEIFNFLTLKARKKNKLMSKIF